MERKLLVLGATSSIARSVCRAFLEYEKTSFVLVSRDQYKLRDIAVDLVARGALSVNTIVADSSDINKQDEILNKANEYLGGAYTVLFAYGSLTQQARSEKDLLYFRSEFDINFTSVAIFSLKIAAQFELYKNGTIAVISSVAGDRGRQSNFTYGSAKGALSIFLQGLRNKLHNKGVKVITIKPGFVDTPMTAGIKKGLLFVSPDLVGDNIVNAIIKGSNEVYTPWFWNPIMFIIRAIPEFIFKKLKL